MVKKLVTQIEKYERYFENIDGIDNPAVNAYSNLLKTVIGLARKQQIKENKSTAREIKEEAERILEAEYGIKRQ